MNLVGVFIDPIKSLRHQAILLLLVSDVPDVLRDWRNSVSELQRLIPDGLSFLPLSLNHLFSLLASVQVVQEVLVFQHWIVLFSYSGDFLLSFSVGSFYDFVVNVEDLSNIH